MSSFLNIEMLVWAYPCCHLFSSSFMTPSMWVIFSESFTASSSFFFTCLSVSCEEKRSRSHDGPLGPSHQHLNDRESLLVSDFKSGMSNMIIFKAIICSSNHSPVVCAQVLSVGYRTLNNTDRLVKRQSTLTDVLWGK